MKLFLFDPVEGKRLEEFGGSPLATYAAQSLDYCIENSVIENIDFCLPKHSNEEWKAHIDAGYMVKGKDVSLLCDYWICFCIGRENCGSDTWWSWVVLPPVSDINFL